jgi:predicted SprT family Zn-dependent metalloprotease
MEVDTISIIYYYYLCRTHWLLNRQQLINNRKDDLKHINEHELTKVNIWFAKSWYNFLYR